MLSCCCCTLEGSAICFFCGCLTGLDMRGISITFFRILVAFDFIVDSNLCVFFVAVSVGLTSGIVCAVSLFKRIATSWKTLRILSPASTFGMLFFAWVFQNVDYISYRLLNRFGVSEHWNWC